MPNNIAFIRKIISHFFHLRPDFVYIANKMSMTGMSSLLKTESKVKHLSIVISIANKFPFLNNPFKMDGFSEGIKAKNKIEKRNNAPIALKRISAYGIIQKRISATKYPMVNGPPPKACVVTSARRSSDIIKINMKKFEFRILFTKTYPPSNFIVAFLVPWLV